MSINDDPRANQRSLTKRSRLHFSAIWLVPTPTFYRPPAGWPTRADLVAYEWYRSLELVGIAVSSAAGVIGRYLRYVFLLVYDVQFELKTSHLDQN
jgi:hypothetical protein